mgnify:CR=1
MDELLALDAGTLILNARIPSPDRIAKWTHRLHPTHGLLWSVEDADNAVADSNPDYRRFALDGEGGLWVAWGIREYRLYRYGLDGTQLLAIAPKRDW